MDRRFDFVNTVMDTRFPDYAGNFLTSWATARFRENGIYCMELFSFVKPCVVFSTNCHFQAWVKHVLGIFVWCRVCFGSKEISNSTLLVWSKHNPKSVLLKQEKIRASEVFSSQNSTETNLKLHEFRSASHNALHLQDQPSLQLKPFSISREISRLKPLARVRYLF